MCLAPLTVCLSISEAVCVRAMLAAYGIHTAANALHYSHVYWLNLFAVGGIGISVLDNDRAAAIALLQPIDDYVNNLESETAAFSRRAWWNCGWSVLIFWYFGTIMPFWVKDRRFSENEDN